MRGCWTGLASRRRQAGLGAGGPAASPPGSDGSSPMPVRRWSRSGFAEAGPRRKKRSYRCDPRCPTGACQRPAGAPPGPRSAGGPAEVFACREGVLVSRTKAINELKSLIVVAPEQLRAHYGAFAGGSARPHRAPAVARADSDRSNTACTVFSCTRSPHGSGSCWLSWRSSTPSCSSSSRQHPAGPALPESTGRRPRRRSTTARQLVTPRAVRNEAAFASLAGVAPLEASSGQRTRHRLNRGGDRALNRALHTVAITRMRCHPESMAYERERTTKARHTRTSDAASSAPSPPSL